MEECKSPFFEQAPKKKKRVAPLANQPTPSALWCCCDLKLNEQDLRYDFSEGLPHVLLCKVGPFQIVGIGEGVLCSCELKKLCSVLLFFSLFFKSVP
jgi:hypothetical protein